MSEPQPAAPTGGGGGGGGVNTGERSNGSHPPVRTLPSPAVQPTTHQPKGDRFPTGGPQQPGDHSNKHTHKTYVRGRGHQRNNNRR